VATLEELQEALTRVVGLFDLLENAKAAVRQITGIREPVWYNLDALQEFLETCRLVVAKNKLEEVQQILGKYISGVQILTQSGNCHPLTGTILHGIRNRDVDSFEGAILKLFKLHELAERARWTRDTLDRLARGAPKIAEDLKATSQEETWIGRIQSVGKAWAWARAHSWLRDYLNAEDIPSLERRSKQIEEDVMDILARLAAVRAWKFCFTRLQEEHRRHLIGWQQAIKKIGKGTGKHAHKYRRDAQQHLNKCREAIPAWVMPLHRVWETIDPSPGMFDVIIVDEASQCGPESLPLMYLGKKLLVVGDDQQISPEAIGVRRDAVHQLMQQHLHDFQHADSFDVESSLFDHAKRRFGNRIVLREHFRCMPEIIRFSNDLSYHDTPLIPLRQYPPERLEPLKVIHVPSGHREGDGTRAINRPEAETLARAIVQCCQDARYKGKTMGVIVLQGEAQAQLIQDMLLKELGDKEMIQRRLICGNPYHFQGDERQIMFLSMVAAPNERIGAFTKETDRRRFNVAASRAQDQMWLFHTATSNDLSGICLRKRLLEYFENPISQITKALGEEAEHLRERAHSANRQIERPPTPFDSWFEVDVALVIAGRGYRVVPQYPFGGKIIDLVVEGKESQLAVECDGDFWHGSEQYERDMERQRKLERCGWHFYRVRECAFNSNPEAALDGLWTRLKQHRIFPVGFEMPDSLLPATISGVKPPTSAQEARANAPHDPLIMMEGTEIGRMGQEAVETQEIVEPRGQDHGIFSPPGPNEDEEVEAGPESSQFDDSTLGEFTGGQEPYAYWRPYPLPDPHTAPVSQIIDGLLAIISVEGPMICHRAYFIYARSVTPPILRVGRQIRKIFNRAISEAIRRELIEARNEESTRDMYQRIARKAGTKPVLVRKRGNRDLIEIPPAELGTMMAYIRQQYPNQTTDELLQATAERFDVGRMTSNIRERLLRVMKRYISPN